MSNWLLGSVGYLIFLSGFVAGSWYGSWAHHNNKQQGKDKEQ